jgi:hypothetical protein
VSTPFLNEYDKYNWKVTKCGYSLIPPLYSSGYMCGSKICISVIIELAKYPANFLWQKRGNFVATESKKIRKWQNGGNNSRKR